MGYLVTHRGVDFLVIPQLYQVPTLKEEVSLAKAPNNLFSLKLQEGVFLAILFNNNPVEVCFLIQQLNLKVYLVARLLNPQQEDYLETKLKAQLQEGYLAGH